MNIAPRDKHKEHTRTIINGPFGVHVAKEICITCGGKFVSWVGRRKVDEMANLRKVSIQRQDHTINLKVPYDEKDQAKELGAKWDASFKSWYIDIRQDKTLFEQWL